MQKATVNQTDGTVRTYIGNTSTRFKDRHSKHKHTFKNTKATQTSLSHYIHNLQNQRIEHEISWEILDRGTPYSPIKETCDLCNKEKFHILSQANPNQLNSRNEIFASCRHKHSFLLIPRERKKKRPPG